MPLILVIDSVETFKVIFHYLNQQFILLAVIFVINPISTTLIQFYQVAMQHFFSLNGKANNNNVISRCPDCNKPLGILHLRLCRNLNHYFTLGKVVQFWVNFLTHAVDCIESRNSFSFNFIFTSVCDGTQCTFFSHIFSPAFWFRSSHCHYVDSG